MEIASIGHDEPPPSPPPQLVHHRVGALSIRRSASRRRFLAAVTADIVNSPHTVADEMGHAQDHLSDRVP